MRDPVHHVADVHEALVALVVARILLAVARGAATITAGTNVDLVLL